MRERGFTLMCSVIGGQAKLARERLSERHGEGQWVRPSGGDFVGCQLVLQELQLASPAASSRPAGEIYGTFPCC